MRKVVVTGFALITPLGLTWQETWENLLAGRSGVKPIRRFDASGCATRIAAEIPEEFEALAAQYVRGRRRRQMARAVLAGYVAAKMAVAHSGLDFDVVDRDRCAVIMGMVDTGHSRIDPQDFWILKTMPHALSAWISLDYKLEGPNYAVSAACASSAFALAQAYDLIRWDRADVVLAGGASAIVNPEHVHGFNELQALSTANEALHEASRPFSRGRDGFVMGEGAGVVVLEWEESARDRGASIWAEMAGHALTSETYNIMAPAKDGLGMAKTMALALKNSGMSPEGIDYINAHGTSTPFNDLYETLAIKKVFGPRARHIPISSTKSMIGHTAAAAGAIEAVVTVLSLAEGVIHPTINYRPDPALDLDYVPEGPRRHPMRAAISNSFGFGGANAVLVFRRSDDSSLA